MFERKYFVVAHFKVKPSHYFNILARDHHSPIRTRSCRKLEFKQFICGDVCWCWSTWILHSASTSCSLVWASSSSISLSWFFKASFSSSVSSDSPSGTVVPAGRTRPSLLNRLLHFSQLSTLDWRSKENKNKKVYRPLREFYQHRVDHSFTFYLHQTLGWVSYWGVIIETSLQLDQSANGAATRLSWHSFSCHVKLQFKCYFISVSYQTNIKR